MKKIKLILAELENLYVGFVHNPLVDLNNFLVDHLNAWAEKVIEVHRDPIAYGIKTGKFKALEFSEDKNGKLTMKDGKREFPIRPVQSKEDLEAAIKQLVLKPRDKQSD